MAEVAAYVVAVAGLTVLIGLSGQISIGNGAFMAVGAYASALLLLHLGWPLELVFAASAVITAAAGAIVGVAAARLRGPYLAGATLMLAVALPSIADKYSGVFGGDQGLIGHHHHPGLPGRDLPADPLADLADRAAALIALVLLANLVRSRVGRSWRAVRDDEVAAALAGLNVARLQVLAFVISAACAGLGGALLAVVSAIVSPGAYTLTLSIGLLTAAVIGGLGSLPGALWGSLLFVLVPTYLTNVASQPRAVQRGQFQHSDRRLRRRAHRRHARLPGRNPRRPAPPVRAGRADRGGPVQRIAPAAPASEHQEEGTR